MSNVIEFPVHRTKAVQAIRTHAKHTVYNLVCFMSEEMNKLYMPVYDDKELQAKVLDVANQYQKILLDYFQNDDNFKDEDDEINLLEDDIVEEDLCDVDPELLDKLCREESE